MNAKIIDLKRENKTSKAGKAFISLRLKTDVHPGKWVSGFGGDENSHWQIGDTVDIEIESKGEYLNFKTNKVNAVSKGDGEASKLYNLINLKVLPLLEFMAEDLKALRKKEIDYPEINE